MGEKGQERKLAEFVKLPKETIIQSGFVMESVTNLLPVRFC